MQADELRAMQAPLKQQYREAPESAVITLSARGNLDDGLTCSVETGKALVQAGLHPATGGDGLSACSGDMLLQALVACAGVTLRAVATALGITLRGGTLLAEGELDFRGTLGGEQGGARGVLEYPPEPRPRHGCRARSVAQPAHADRAVLRGVPDAAQPA